MKTAFTFLLSILVAIQAFAYDFTAEIEGQECFFNIIGRGVCEITYADSARVDGIDYFNKEKKYAGELALPYSVEHEGVEYYIARIGELLRYGNFRDAVNRQWQTFSPVSNDWLQYITDLYSEALATADLRNNARWPSASYKGLAPKINNTRYWYEKNLGWFKNHLPQPTNAIAGMDSPDRPSAIYNLHGQRLSTEPTHGIFIRGGKKVYK